jgi:hypothetical protein
MAGAKRVDDWDEYRKLILAELKRLHEGIEEIKKKVEGIGNSDIKDLNTKMAVLETEVRIRSGLWGMLAGLIPGLGSLIYTMLHK